MNIGRKQFLKWLGISGMSGLFIPGMTTAEPPDKSETIKPTGLKRGDTIGLISPAGLLDSYDRYREIEQEIRELGYHTKTGPHAESSYGYLAGRDEDRASDLNAMFSDNEIDGIIPFRGGWGSNRILDQLDYELIRKHPKPIIGFSDITSLLLAIYAKTGMVTFHGPVGKSKWNEYTVHYFEKALISGMPFTMKPNSGKEEGHVDPVETITPGKAEGKLVGGNLTVLTSMLGSDYLPDFNDAILFLEDIGEDIYRIDRMMTQLKLNGILDRIAGFVFGRCTDCKPDSLPSLTLSEVIDDHVAPLDIPSFMGTNIGHIDHIFTLPIGIKASINADRGEIKTLEPATE